jgi:NAD(P)-dependent dehydrogenase (short-subunit alcohol dehydrogenase family)
MEIDLSGRSAFISGSTQGIGRAIAAKLAACGASVTINGRDEAKVRAVAEDLGVEGVAADVSTAEGARQVLAALPHVDILVNNLGIFAPAPVLEIDDDTWQRFWDVNVMSAIRLTRAYLPGMVERGWGRVQFISSESALQITPEMVQYAMTKTAMLAVSRGMAESVPRSGVTVNAILPGPTHTEGVEGMLESLAAEQGVDVAEAGRRFVESERPSSLLGRLIEPEEVASLAVYLASEQASATTGAALRVDGGVTRAAFG